MKLYVETDPYTELPLAGKRVVITGATDGIGKEMARALIARGAHLTIVARNTDKANAVVDKLTRDAQGTAEHVLGDLASLASVRAAAAELGSRYGQIDVLINNAGLCSPRSQTTVDGYDLMAGTNHLGPFLLTNLLLEQIRQAPSARIVTTASDAHRSARGFTSEHFADPVKYGRFGAHTAYGRSKLLNILFTKELADRLKNTNVTANAFCPGMVATNLVSEDRLLTAILQSLTPRPWLQQPDEGAWRGLRLVLDQSLHATSGEFFSSVLRYQSRPPMRLTTDPSLARRVWERSAELVGLPSDYAFSNSPVRS